MPRKGMVDSTAPLFFLARGKHTMSANFRSRHGLLMTAAASLFLSGCDAIIPIKSEEAIQSEFSNNKNRLQAAKGQDKRISSDPLSISNDVWVGNQAMRMRRGQPLPSKFEQGRGFAMVSSAPMNLPMIGTQISNSTNIPVRLGDMTLASATDGSSGGMFGAEANSGEANSLTNAAMSISYEGPLSTFLDQIASQYDVSWRFDGQSIYFYRYESKTFMVEAMPGKSTVGDEFDTGADSGGGGSSSGSGSSSSQDMKQKNQMEAELDYWKDLEAAVKGMMGNDGAATIMQSSGTITVTARPAKLAQVAQFLDAENNRLSRQIAIDVSVYSVTLRDTDSYGLNLDAVFDGKLFGTPTTITLDGIDTPTDPSAITQGTLSIAMLSPHWDITAVPTALSTVGNVAVVTRSPIVTLNNRPASRKISVDRAYLASTSTTISEGVATTSLTPGTINTGFTLQLLPRMMADGRILLQYSIRISDLIGEPESFGPPSNQIQLPEVDNKVFVQQAVMQNGATLVLAGFERNRDSGTTRGIGSATNWLLGGGMTNDQSREQLVITITPHDISPERGSLASP